MLYRTKNGGVGYNMIDFGVQKKTGHSISQNILQDLQGDKDGKDIQII